MKKLITMFVVFLITVNINLAQEISPSLYNSVAKNTITQNYTPNNTRAAVIAPSFVGGNIALTQFIQDNIKYPELAKRKGVEGTVIMEYYIMSNGAIENISIVKSIGSGLDEEAIRVVKSMPNWNPGMQNNKTQRVKYKLPITFELN